MYQRIKGFRDFYPEEMDRRRRTIDILERTARRYGYREVGTPALEPTQMYVDKSGDEIVEQLYRFTDHGGRDVSLSPELTPTLARMIVAKQQALLKPVKWFSTRPFWRYEEPQEGRFREFYQTNVDIFGSSEPEADAEILAWAADSLTALGLSEADFEFRVSHRDLLGGLFEAIGGTVDVPAAIRAVDKSDKIEPEAYHELLLDAGLTDDEAREFRSVLHSEETGLDDLVDFAGTDRIRTAVSNLRAVLAATEDFGVRSYCSVSLDTARGLDYYTGVVFECFDSTGAVNRSIFGGGRYDDLIEGFGGQPMPAVGVAPGHATLQLLLERAGVTLDRAGGPDYYVLTVGDTRSVGSRIARDLRDAGNVVETDLAGRSFGNQLQYADGIDAETVVIVGERDLEDDSITLKDMRSGEQVAVPVVEFPGDIPRPTIDDYS